MNKQQARREAQSNTRSIDDLRALILAAKDRGGASRVNPIFTIERVCEIYLGSLAPWSGDAVPAGLYRDPYTGRMKPSRESLTIANILRDCA